ncbi:MAG TPA: hypothetical protein VHU18_02980 [Rhizomicrobium sp.]|jgi:hypothetical protein|nr:hypothetical protein [Rhizomicrobium sp.]
MRTFSIVVFAMAIAAQASAEPQFDPKPWLEDLQQTREVLSTKYANLEWAVFDREANLPQLFVDAQKKRIAAAQSETEARAAFDRPPRKLGDGHVVFEWPSHRALQSDAPASKPREDYVPPS